jgi:uncharacterized protein
MAPVYRQELNGDATRSPARSERLFLADVGNTDGISRNQPVLPIQTIMNVFITGGGGFVGGHLIPPMLERGWKVVTVGSSTRRPTALDERVTYLTADTTRDGDWQASVAQAEVVINLAGRSIFHWWSNAYKRQIYDSRILTTRNLVKALSSDRSATLINASAVGFYGDRADEILTEEQEPGKDFLATVCQDWESEAQKAVGKGTRVVVTRFGVVLGGNGGAIGMMALPYRFMVGGPLGSGRQWFPWVHITDLVSGILVLIERSSSNGVYNLTSPHPVQNRALAKTIGRVLRRPSLFRVPAWVLNLTLREFGSLLLYSQRAIPERLMADGFEFRYPDFEPALRQVLGASDSRA